MKEFNIAPSEANTFKEPISILFAGPIISYYENVRIPAITMSVRFIDTDGIVSKLPILGGEYIDCIIEFVTDKGAKTFEIKKEHKMVVNRIFGVETESSRQVASLDCITLESLFNETTRVTKKYTGAITTTVSSLLGNTAEGIDTDPRGINTKKKVDIDTTSNAFSFLGNSRRPYDIIQWLCPKSMRGGGSKSTAGGSNEEGGFLFYETLDGFHFKSVDVLYEEKDEELVFEKVEDANRRDNRILAEEYNRNRDIIMNLRDGGNASATAFWNVYSQDYKPNKLGEQAVTTVEKIKGDEAPKLPANLQKKPVSSAPKFIDPGHIQNGAAIDSKDDDSGGIRPVHELDVYADKGSVRYSTLFSQALQIKIPCNPDLRAGQMIRCNFPLPTSDQKKLKMSTQDKKDISGRYMISELRHDIGNNQAYTYLGLIRDDFFTKQED